MHSVLRLRKETTSAIEVRAAQPRTRSLSQARPVEDTFEVRKGVLEYIADLAKELGIVAHESDSDHLAHLLILAHDEAITQARRLGH
jgi:hypothetical protein